MDELNSLQSELHLDDTLSTDVRYADDTTLIAQIFDKLKLSTRELESACKKWGVKVNTSKCKIMSKENDSIKIDSGLLYSHCILKEDYFHVLVQGHSD